MADLDFSRLEADLRDLGQALDVPPAPDVRTAVRAALVDDAARARARRPGRSPWDLRQRAGAAVAGLALALASLLVISPGARAAALDVLSFAGIDLRDEPPPPGPRGTGTLPGEAPMTLDAARKRVSFPLVVPRSLGEPDRVSVSDNGRVVTLMYDAVPGRPAVRLDQFVGGLQPYFAKFVDSTKAEYVQLGDGREGLWVRVPHDVGYLDRTGTVRPGTLRVSARTLVWLEGDVTVRVEGLPTKAAALAVARSAATSRSAGRPPGVRGSG
jgi:hypothetical protein